MCVSERLLATHLEHASELGGVLEAAGVLELGDHARLGVVGSGSLVDEALSERLGIELLEDVLVLDKLEECHRTIQRRLKIVFLAGGLVRLAQRAVDVGREELRRLGRIGTGRLVVVDEFAAGLVERGDEAGFVVERLLDRLVVATVHGEQSVDVRTRLDLCPLLRVAEDDLDRGETGLLDVLLESGP